MQNDFSPWTNYHPGYCYSYFALLISADTSLDTHTPNLTPVPRIQYFCQSLAIDKP